MVFLSSGQSNAKTMANPVGVWMLMAGKYLAAGSREGQQLVSNIGAHSVTEALTLGHITSRDKH